MYPLHRYVEMVTTTTCMQFKNGESDTGLIKFQFRMRQNKLNHLDEDKDKDIKNRLINWTKNGE